MLTILQFRKGSHLMLLSELEQIHLAGQSSTSFRTFSANKNKNGKTNTTPELLIHPIALTSTIPSCKKK